MSMLHPRRGASVAVGILAVASLVGACGGKSDDENIRSTVGQLAKSDPAVCDKMTKKFLDQAFDGKAARCKKEAKEDRGEPEKLKIKSVKVNGEKATVNATVGGEAGKVGLVKDGDWKIDSVANAQSGSSGGGTASQSGDKVAAQGTAQAFLNGVRDEDEAVVCGLLSEQLAREVFKVKEAGVAQCVQRLANYDWTRLQGQLQGVKVESVATSGTGKGAGGGATLSKGIQFGLKNLGDRWVITTIK